MNIIVLATSAEGPTHGGLTTYVRNFTQNMAERGHRVYFVTGAIDKNKVGRFLSGNMVIIKFIVPNNKILRYIQYMVKFLRIVKEIVNTDNIDFINIHSFRYLSLFLLFKKINHIPLIYTFHACRPFELQYDWMKNNDRTVLATVHHHIKYLYTKFFERRAIQKARSIIVLSNYVSNQIKKYYPNEYLIKHPIIIPCGIPNGSISDMTPHDSKQKLGFRNDQLILFTLRRMTPRMGLEHLLEAVNLIRDNSNWLLVLGSSGPLENHIKSLIRSYGLSDRIVMPGFISKDLLPVYYRASDVFILPTLELEGFGIVTIEALANRCVVISSDAGATPEIVNDYYPEFIYNAGNSEELANLIKYYIQNRVSYTEERREEKYESFAKKYNWDKICSKWEEILT